MTAGDQVFIDFEPRGAARALFRCHDRQVLLSGPAGTGKSRACLEKLHLCALKYPGMKALVARKALSSLTATGLRTYAEKVLHPTDNVYFFGGSSEEPAHYTYPNGSWLVVGGLDKASKIMSTEYDLIYVQEATELSENDWEHLTTRLRNGVLPYQQLSADCNPDAPTHWLKVRCDAGKTTMLESRHEDNPRLHDGRGWTEEGRNYIALLDQLSGARKARLRYGKWVAAEGAVYDEWDRRVHLIDAFEMPASWRRIRAIDFGYSNPFCCQWWAIDHDGRMYLYRELYYSQRLVTDHARQIVALTGNERIDKTLSDHDAEDRATLHAAGIQTIPAFKDISPGIQAVQARLRVAGDGKPRLFVFRDALVERDERMADLSQPVNTEQEFDAYMWPKGADGKPLKEEPLDLYNHGMDTMRYAVAYVDDIAHRRAAIVSPPPLTSPSKFRGVGASDASDVEPVPRTQPPPPGSHSPTVFGRPEQHPAPDRTLVRRSKWRV